MTADFVCHMPISQEACLLLSIKVKLLNITHPDAQTHRHRCKHTFPRGVLYNNIILRQSVIIELDALELRKCYRYLLGAKKKKTGEGTGSSC